MHLYMAIYCYANSKVTPPCESKKSDNISPGMNTDYSKTVRQRQRSNWAATWQNQQSDCAPSEDSDQPGHPPSLIRVFAVRLMGN